ncbi:MAG: prepilin-type N-terminal cleavage/methylation domain-containing protein [Planctomycetes bacterium]|nr:prepilin-type N-terminal cleavage/methylation domain-containing protein [Planctomycetota bacterium]
MSGRSTRSGFTLIEVLIVVVILAVLAAAIIPQFTDSTDDAQESVLLTNLNVLRTQIQVYRANHGGLAPSGDLSELLKTTDLDGSDGGTWGPYLQFIPKNNLTDSNAVKTIATDNATAGDLTPGGGGWIYSTTSSKFWVDHADYFDR